MSRVGAYARHLMGEVVSPFGREPETAIKAVLSLTYRCNFRCPTCPRGLTTPPTDPELSTEEWKIVLTRLSNWKENFEVEFEGGEPLLRKDVVELVRHAVDCGMRAFLTTNASLLTPVMIRSLSDAGLKGICISMNALDAKLHDASRGHPGSHSQIMRAMDWFRSCRPFQVTVNVVITDGTLDQIVPMLEWAETAPIDHIVFSPAQEPTVLSVFDRSGKDVSAWGRVSHSRMGLNMDADPCATRMGELLEWKRSGRSSKLAYWVELYEALHDCARGRRNYLRKRCRVARVLWVDPYANVRHCFSKGAVGNLLRQSPGEIWGCAKAIDTRRAIYRCRQRCMLSPCFFPRSPSLRRRLRSLFGSVS